MECNQDEDEYCLVKVEECDLFIKEINSLSKKGYDPVGSPYSIDDTNILLMRKMNTRKINDMMQMMMSNMEG